MRSLAIILSSALAVAAQSQSSQSEAATQSQSQSVAQSQSQSVAQSQSQSEAPSGSQTVSETVSQTVSSTGAVTPPPSTTPDPSAVIVDIMIPDFSNGTDKTTTAYVGSIIDVKDSKTTLVVNCKPGGKAEDCDVSGGATVTKNTATEILSMTLTNTDLPAPETAVLDCALHGTTSADCVYKFAMTIPPDNTKAIAAYNGSATVTSSVSASYTGAQVGFVQATITAGAEKLKNGAGVKTAQVGVALGAMAAAVLLM